MQPYKIWKNEKFEKNLSKWHRKKNFGEKCPEKHEGGMIQPSLSYKTPRNGGHLALLNQNTFPFRFWLAKEVHKSNVAAENG